MSSMKFFNRDGEISKDQRQQTKLSYSFKQEDDQEILDEANKQQQETWQSPTLS